MSGIHTCHPFDTGLASREHLAGLPWVIGHGSSAYGFVQRTMARGRGWRRFVTMDGGWRVTAYRSRKSAILGEFCDGESPPPSSSFMAWSKAVGL